ncbi:sugar ABC transporter substrate-binding protein [Petroclostridium sp. X23]|uniref:ABC transporter substrate-binding protein n=1 Tax=Petroclostridium sp. X23 TaxID=3045146 RepID=UPI0024AD96A7|nr:sugar ABC transporter substrate-binding protein [Petroclostridium sp. X23]WHH60076.1 sugar ABC transporter substrate-binding protein [Petroclostridium sp. X23]
MVASNRNVIDFRRINIIISVLFILVMTLGACEQVNKKGSISSSQEEGNVTITYGLWGTETEIEVQKEIARAIENYQPGIKIEVRSYMDSDTFWNKLPAEIAAKTAPDIVKLTNEGYYEYAVKGVILPINEFIKRENVDLSIYRESSKRIWTINDQLFGIPVSAAPAMFFINKDLWEQAGLGEYPTTWEEVRKAAGVLTKDGVFGLGLNNHEYHITNYVLSFGGGWGNGRTINSEENINALKFIIEMYNQKLAVAPKQLGYGWDGEVFANKKSAMTTGGWWYIGYLKEVAPDLPYEILPIPEGTRKAGTMHSDAIVVLSDAKDKTAAVKAAVYLAGEKAQEKLMNAVGIHPTITKLEDRYYQLYPKTKAIQPMLQYAEDFGYPENSKAFIGELIRGLDSILFDNSQQTLKELLEKIDTAHK